MKMFSKFLAVFFTAILLLSCVFSVSFNASKGNSMVFLNWLDDAKKFVGNVVDSAKKFFGLSKSATSNPSNPSSAGSSSSSSGSSSSSSGSSSSGYSSSGGSAIDSTKSSFASSAKNALKNVLDASKKAFGFDSNSSGNIGGKVIVLDPGHGTEASAAGSGCSTHNPPSFGITEDVMAYDISLRVKERLEKAGAKVLMTRTATTNPGCSARANVANEAAKNNKYVIFLSIHINASGGTGHETFYKAGRVFSANSIKLAQLIEQELTSKTGIKSRGAKPDSETSVGSLGVFNAHTPDSSFPSVLTEPLFIDIKEENDKLKNPDFRDKIADALVSAVSKYYGGDLSTGNESNLINCSVKCDSFANSAKLKLRGSSCPLEKPVDKSGEYYWKLVENKGFFAKKGDLCAGAAVGENAGKVLDCYCSFAVKPSTAGSGDSNLGKPADSNANSGTAGDFIQSLTVRPDLQKIVVKKSLDNSVYSDFKVFEGNELAKILSPEKKIVSIPLQKPEALNVEKVYYTIALGHPDSANDVTFKILLSKGGKWENLTGK